MADIPATGQLILGTARWSRPGRAVPPQQAARLLETATRLGVSGVDTAASYGSGRAERILGRHAPTELVIQTKAGPPTYDWPEILQLPARAAQTVRQRLPRDAFPLPDRWARSLALSLQRLRQETVDTFFIHSPRGDVLLEAYRSTAQELLERGLTRSIGISADRPVQQSIPPWCTVVQVDAQTALLERDRFTSLIRQGHRIQINRVMAARPMLATQDVQATVIALRSEVPGCDIVFSTNDPAHINAWVAGFAGKTTDITHQATEARKPH